MEQVPRRLTLPPLWQKKSAQADQRRFILAPERFSLAATGTKTGKTLGCAEWILLNAGNRPRTLWWWIAPSIYQAEIGFQRVKDLIPPGWANIVDSKRTIELGNGARIEFKTGEKPNLLFGAAVHGAVVDEASRMRQLAWNALMTTMTQTRGQVRVASNTDQGRQNWFYELYQKGLALNPNGSKKFPDFVSWSIKTYENPHINGAVIKDLKDTLPPMAYQALVEAVFPEDALTVFRNVRGVVMEEDPAGWDGASPMIERYRHDHSYVVGVDLAKYSDYTVVCVMDNDTRRVVYFNRLNLRLWETQMELVEKVSRYYGKALVVIDSTGVGDPIYERLTLLGAPIVPYVFNNATKQRLIGHLGIGIESQDLYIPPGLTQLIHELESYEYQISEAGVIRFGAPNKLGAFDDSVIALALAYYAAAQPFAVGYASVSRRDEVEAQVMQRKGEERTHSRRQFKKGKGF